VSPDELKQRFPRISASCLAANSALPSAEPKQVVRDGALAEKEREGGNSGRCLVRITSFRSRLLDPDNLVGGAKYFVDSMRYCGAIANDDPSSIVLEVRQEKVKTKAQEKTVIELIPL
jgi:hypothetical protein